MLWISTFSVQAQTSLGKMTAFWRTCMMTGGKDQITPWHLYKNPVAYLDDTAFPYNYAKYGITPSSEFVLHGDVASFVRFLSGPGTTDSYDLAKRVNGKVVLQTDALTERFAKTEASGAIKNYMIVLDQIPVCFPDPENVTYGTYGQTAMPADMDEWTTFIKDMCEGIKNILGEEKANNLSFRMGTEAHSGHRYNYTDPNVMLNFYKITAQAVKSVLPQAKFGPYNTCVPWIASKQVLKFNDLVQYCKDYDLPLDFIGYSWYVQGADPLIDPQGFVDHWKAAAEINPDLNNVPIEYYEFGSLGTEGTRYMRPTCDNAAAIFNMLMDSKAAGFTGTFHWPVDVKIVDSPATYVMNALGWVFQVLDHTTGGDAYLLSNTLISDNVGGSTIRTLGVFHCDNNKNYLIVSSFNPTIGKVSQETVKVKIPKSYINLKENITSVKVASLDRSNCPLLAIRNDLQENGYLSEEYTGKPYVTNFSSVHYRLVQASVTDMTNAKNLIRDNRTKYVNLCKNSFTLKEKTITMTKTQSSNELNISVTANSISVIVLEE